MKGILWALGLAAAAALTVVWLADRIPVAQVAGAIGVATPEPAQAPVAASGGAPRWRPAAAAERAGTLEPVPAEIGTGREDDGSGSEDLQPPADPVREPAGSAAAEDRRDAAPSLAVTALCAPGGSRCGSSADCCPGLACNGGMAGYGTAGRCE